MIERLTEEVINRIAAGEVIQRPVSAVKEMLENSIDAGSTQITVMAHQGGIKKLSIQDNGSGITKKDLKIVCERFTTSKLKQFEDLENIGTYGFRGEALSSVSNVAHVTITSKIKDSPCAFRAKYSSGKLDGKIVPVAGVPGTTILVEDMFYNAPARRQALKHAGEEYGRILDVVSHYAIHKGLTEEEKEQNETLATSKQKLGVSMICKKQGSQTPDLHTNATNSKLDNIRSIYGSVVANELIFVSRDEDKETMKTASSKKAKVDKNDEDDEEEEDEEEEEQEQQDRLDEADGSDEKDMIKHMRCDGYVSNANYSRKKSVYIFFINDRLVSCTTLKRALDSLYAEFLPKGESPFVYLSIHLNPTQVDVNVHPTKREVHFLHEEAVVNDIVHLVKKRLKGANKSRIFYTQQTLISQPSSFAVGEDENNRKPKKDGSSTKKKRDPSKLVRTDSSTMAIDSYVTRTKRPKTGGGEGDLQPASPNNQGKIDFAESIFEDRISDECGVLSAVQALINEYRARGSRHMEKRLHEIVFVGFVDEQTCLVQSGLELYYMNFVELARELFYQETLNNFGKFSRIVLEKEPNIERMIEQALRFRIDLGKEHGLRKDEQINAKAKELCQVLLKRHAMLDEYFRLKIDTDKKTLQSLPEIIPKYVPSDAAALAMFLLQISRDVDWDSEKDCFETMAFELSSFYAHFQPLSIEKIETINKDDSWVHDKTDMRFIVKNQIIPKIRKRLVPSSSHANESNAVFVQIATLSTLYKIFERC